MISRNFQLLLIAFFIQTIILIITCYRNHIKENSCENDYKKKCNRSTLYDIGMKYYTDKVYTHHYETLYDKYLSRYRDTSVRLLEIGLGCDMGQYIGASAQTWREYFGDKADIHFLEVDEKCGKKWEANIGKQINITIHYGNQENIVFLERFKLNMQQFDIIIDNGGHTMNQQKTSFMKLLPLVRSGGLHVIEDLETSYSPRYDGSYWSPLSTISFIKTFVDEIQLKSPKKTISVGGKVFSFEIGNNICFFTVK